MTLGIHCDTDNDTLHISTPILQPEGKLTKIELVSDIAKTYDILGWFPPAILFAKCLLQQVWESRVDWDDPVPETILSNWQRWSEELPTLTRKALPR